MSRFNSKLDHVRVAAPCSADWDSMLGDERVRFCGQCKLNVYNLSEMKRAEAELLIARAEGRLCVRYYQRRDGSIITQNCPVGLQAIKRRLSRVANAIGSSLLSFFAGIGAFGIAERLFLIDVPRPGQIQGAIAVRRIVSPPPFVPVEMKGEVLMGDMVMPVRPRGKRAR
ncbi:MAG: hypothetical protein DMF69_12465 [Acidobacteria bacterium]|nr:MAG: hypothetical protein DMF69_12465 [Acidobacteriota bacterium]